MIDDKKIKSEIEQEKKKLREELKKKDEEASEKLDKLLEYKKSDPDKELKKQEEKERIFFRKEPNPIKTLLTEKPEQVEYDRKKKIENLTNTYIDLLKDRLSKSFPDFTLEEYIGKAQAKAILADEELSVEVNKKSLLKEELKLRILVRPLYGKEKSDIEFVLKKLKELVDVYTIIILVGDELTQEAINFVDKYQEPDISLLVSLPAQSILYPDSKPLTKIYAKWFEGKATSLKDVLKSQAEDIDGKKVVSVDKVVDEFGFTEDQAYNFLKTCKFLEEIPDTDSFFFL